MLFGLEPTWKVDVLFPEMEKDVARTGLGVWKIIKCNDGKCYLWRSEAWNVSVDLSYYCVITIYIPKMTIEWVSEYTKRMSEYILSDVELCSWNSLSCLMDEKQA